MFLVSFNSFVYGYIVWKEDCNEVESKVGGEDRMKKVLVLAFVLTVGSAAFAVPTRKPATHVPEPGTILLLGSGAALALKLRKKKQ